MTPREAGLRAAAKRWGDRTPSDRFWEKVDAAGDCWDWTGTRTLGGYGRVRWHGRLENAHRVGYALLVGPIPDGMHLDHLCRRRRCVNPDHLEPVTPKENMQRGYSPSARFRDSCAHGHPASDRRRMRSGKPWCVSCDRDKYRRRVAREGAYWRTDHAV